MPEASRLLIVHPVDLTLPKVGGIHSFITSFIKFMPDGFEVEHVGIRVGAGRLAQPAWRVVEVQGRPIRTLPLVSVDEAEARSAIPLAVRFGAGLLRAARLIRTAGRVAQFHRPGIALPLLRRRMPKVQVIHLSAQQLRSASSESRWRRAGAALPLIEDRILPKMDLILSVNEEVTEQYRARFPQLASRMVFVSNWVDETIFTMLDEAQRKAARAALVHDLGIDPDSRLLVAAGRLERQKQPSLAVKALSRQDGDVHLLLIGDGSLRSEVETRRAELRVEDRVHLMSPRPREELARIFNAADAMVIASAHETGPTVALEALASGLPIASTAVGRVPALLSDPLAGRLARSADADGLATAIREVLAMSVNPAGHAAARRAARPYHAAAILAPVYALHAELGAAPEDS